MSSFGLAASEGSAFNPSMNFADTLTIESRITLNSGHQIPCMGFGTSSLRNAEEACNEAIKIGYRHLDSAQSYGTEAAVTQAAQKCESGWESIFLTTKIPGTKHGKEACEEALRQSLVHTANKPWDLVLLHEPLSEPNKRHQAYAVLAEAQKKGDVKSIGVSNFGVHHLEELQKAGVGPLPAVNQLELHPWFQQKSIVDYCQRNNILLQAYCPLAQGKHMSDETLVKIAGKANKTPAQVLLRWSLQKGFVPLPQSNDPQHMMENTNIFDFKLSSEDMSELDKLDEGIDGAVAWTPQLSEP
ncbi:hypothetical protein PGT21_024126 [Puccinia graminis f. sp. tritici]|uniref:NADP-dependent oxidoreductase domain-containing protein n=1 Tax=Puccinia graminis f. sp. tritici TaxID=56615 RepID=A0A5B0RCJ2_PUCGR|nr:hypothetical protein PGT21_024126 [Puccinia graminis f. sp. tritici]KAA1123486.1 hypothetical protein PGTUg99_019828 [Puccinia graminis f. sp. tritici]